MEQELFAYWLYTLRGIGAKKRHELQQIYGNAEQIYYGDKTKLKESPVFSEQDKTLLGKPETVKEIKHKMQRMEQRGIRFCSQESEAFPKKLRYIPDPPYALFYRGMLPDTDRPAIAIVGGRNAGYESREIAAGFGRQLAENLFPEDQIKSSDPRILHRLQNRYPVPWNIFFQPSANHRLYR